MTPTYVTYRYMMMGLAALTNGGISCWVASRRSRVASRLGMRGLKRQRALLDPFWGSVEPLVRWMGVRVSGILSDKQRDKLDLLLTHAGDFLGLTADEYFGLCVLSGISFGLVATVVVVLTGKLPMLVPMLTMLGSTVPHIVIDDAKQRRFREINRGLPYAIDLMSLGMSAGLDFPGSVHQVVSKSKTNQALRDELGYILQQFQLGRTRAQVLAELSRRVPIETVREFTQALLQAEERGTPVSAALEIQATVARIKRTNLAENAASDMKAKMVLPAMMMVGVCLMLIGIPSVMMIDQMSGGMR
jgi:tight adherence protein C